MAMIRKEHVDAQLAKFDQYCGELRLAVAGVLPSPNLAHRYGCETEQLQAEYRDVDLDALVTAIRHFEAEVDGLKFLKKKVTPPLHRV